MTIARLWPWLALSALLVRVSPAQGKEPACFPERTILQASPLWDDQGRELGGVRAGQVVRVLDEGTGDKRTSLVEVDGPVAVRGYVLTGELRVFLKEELALEPGRLWMLAETPVRITAQSGDSVAIRWVGPHDDESSTVPPAVACSALAGLPIGRLWVDGCHGATVSGHPQAAGTPAYFRNETALVLDRPGKMRLRGQNLGLLRVNGDRAWVELIQAERFSERLRIRAWVSRGEVVTGTPSTSYFSEHLCCEGMLLLKLGSRGGVLGHAVDLQVTPQSSPFAHVPAGTRFRVLGPPQDGMRQIAFWFPAWDNTVHLAISGWVPVSVLPAIPEPTEDPTILGRLVIEGSEAPFDFQDFEVGASSEGDDGGPASIRTGRDGRFVLKVNDSGPLRLDAHSPDGALAGAIQDVTALPGGNEEVTISMRPAAFIEGRVRNRVGAWLPHVEVLGMAEHEPEPSVRVLTDDRGRFRMPLVPGPYALSAHEPGQQWSAYVHATAPEQGVVLELWRRRAILGAVPRVRAGCAARGVEISTTPSSARLKHFRKNYPVEMDCTFAADEVGRAWNSVDITAVDSSKRLSAIIGTRGKFHDRIWDEDPDPICLGGGCAPNWQRASVHANVVDQDGVLVASPAVVSVEIKGAGNRSCQTSAGTCFIHGLPPQGTATLTVQLGSKSHSTKIRLSPGVAEVLLRLD
jgi:hypothetical protein